MWQICRSYCNIFRTDMKKKNYTDRVLRWAINHMSLKIMGKPWLLISQIARIVGPTWDPPGSCRPQMGPMLAPWILLSGMFYYSHCFVTKSQSASAGKGGYTSPPRPMDHFYNLLVKLTFSHENVLEYIYRNLFFKLCSSCVLMLINAWNI